MAWVCNKPLSRLCGGRTDAERRAALRQYTEQPVLQGAVERPWERSVAGLVLGTETFARSLKPGLRVKEREQRRNSYIGYRVAVTHDVAKVAMESGNSPRIIQREYLELAIEEEGKRWFNVFAPAPGKKTTALKKAGRK